MTTSPNAPCSPRRDGSSWYEKLVARGCLGGAILAGAAAIYQMSVTFSVGYWLWGQWSLFAVFWGCTLPLVLLFPLHLCRRCRHERCPLHHAMSP